MSDVSHLVWVLFHQPYLHGLFMNVLMLVYISLLVTNLESLGWSKTLLYITYIIWVIKGISLCLFLKSLIAVSASTISILSTLLSEDGGYLVTEFPPLACTTKNSNFYMLILPLNAHAMIGVCQLIVIGWIIHQVFQQCMI